jgi:ATP-dependent Clp protease ATP-binding subunit ClpA
VFERFTERARQVIVLAQDEARELKHDYIGVEHLLLGLFRVERSPVRELLVGAGVTAEEVRAKLVASVGEGTEDTVGQIPFTLRARGVLGRAVAVAFGPGENSVTPEHILLAIVRGEGVREGLARILAGPVDLLYPPAVRRRGPWWNRAEFDTRAFVIFVGTAFAVGVLLGWVFEGY